MPSVVTRWHGLGAQKPVLARLMNEATVCGAFVPSSSKVRSPHVVLTVATKVLPAAVALAGTCFCCFGVVWFAGGAVQPAASFWPAASPPELVGVLTGVVDRAAGVAVSELPTSLGTTMTAAMTRMTARITPKTCLSRVESLTGGLAVFCCSSWRLGRRARSRSLVTNLPSYRPHGRCPRLRHFREGLRCARSGAGHESVTTPLRREDLCLEAPGTACVTALGPHPRARMPGARVRVVARLPAC